MIQSPLFNCLTFLKVNNIVIAILGEILQVKYHSKPVVNTSIHIHLFGPIISIFTHTYRLYIKSIKKMPFLLFIIYANCLQQVGLNSLKQK